MYAKIRFFLSTTNTPNKNMSYLEIWIRPTKVRLQKSKIRSYLARGWHLLFLTCNKLNVSLKTWTVIFNFHATTLTQLLLIFQHAPGIPKVLVGNRLHLAFRRQVDQLEAEVYAERHSMGFFEVSPLVNFNISESFVELARMALKRNGMERLWRSNKGTIIFIKLSE